MPPAEPIEFWNGQWIEIQTSEGDLFHSQIGKIEKHRLHINKPVNRENKVMPYTYKQSVTVIFHDHKRGFCMFESLIYSQQNEFTLELPASEDAIKNVQRRRFFRVPAKVEVVLHIVTDESAESDPIHVLTDDISGGGIAFLSAAKWEPDQIVEGTLNLKSNSANKLVPFKGKTIYSTKQSEDCFRTAVEFTEVKEPALSEIMKFCISKQIELRNKLKNYPI